MGAYTCAASSTFNGFTRPYMVYVAPVADYDLVRPPSSATAMMARTNSACTDEGVSMEDQASKDQIIAADTSVQENDINTNEGMTCATQGDCYEVPSLPEVEMFTTDWEEIANNVTIGLRFRVFCPVFSFIHNRRPFFPSVLLGREAGRQGVVELKRWADVVVRCLFIRDDFLWRIWGPVCRRFLVVGRADDGGDFFLIERDFFPVHYDLFHVLVSYSSLAFLVTVVLFFTFLITSFLPWCMTLKRPMVPSKNGKYQAANSSVEPRKIIAEKYTSDRSVDWLIDRVLEGIDWLIDWLIENFEWSKKEFWMEKEIANNIFFANLIRKRNVSRNKLFVLHEKVIEQLGPCTTLKHAIGFRCTRTQHHYNEKFFSSWRKSLSWHDFDTIPICFGPL